MVNLRAGSSYVQTWLSLIVRSIWLEPVSNIFHCTLLLAWYLCKSEWYIYIFIGYFQYHIWRRQFCCRLSLSVVLSTRRNWRRWSLAQWHHFSTDLQSVKMSDTFVLYGSSTYATPSIPKHLRHLDAFESLAWITWWSSVFVRICGKEKLAIGFGLQRHCSLYFDACSLCSKYCWHFLKSVDFCWLMTFHLILVHLCCDAADAAFSSLPRHPLASKDVKEA